MLQNQPEVKRKNTKIALKLTVKFYLADNQ